MDMPTNTKSYDITTHWVSAPPKRPRRLHYSRTGGLGPWHRMYRNNGGFWSDEALPMLRMHPYWWLRVGPYKAASSSMQNALQRAWFCEYPITACVVGDYVYVRFGQRSEFRIYRP